MCKCGCDTCDDNKAPIIKEEKKSLLSEGLEYHLNYNKFLIDLIFHLLSYQSMNCLLLLHYLLF